MIHASRVCSELEPLLTALLSAESRLRPTLGDLLVHPFLAQRVPQHMCGVCLTRFAASSGVECSGATSAPAHFACDNCFSTYTAVETAVPLARLEQWPGGRMPCFFSEGKCRCSGCYDDVTVAQHASQPAFATLLSARRRLSEAHIEREQARRLRLEQEKWALLPDHSRRVAAARMHVLENILTVSRQPTGSHVLLAARHARSLRSSSVRARAAGALGASSS